MWILFDILTAVPDPRVVISPSCCPQPQRGKEDVRPPNFYKRNRRRGHRFACTNYRDRLSDGRPVTSDTLFEIGSITKVFTALLLANLVRRGEMAFDDPVARHLPDDFH